VICIADSGSTKTDWVLVDEKSGDEHRFVSMGLNPFYVHQKKIEEVFLSTIPQEHLSKIVAIHFYGAGCSSDKRNQIVQEALTNASSCKDEFVYHDLLGAARAACQFNEGVASILGTGSNSCLYDGLKILDNVDNLGFVLGDEGSGGHIGKELIRARCYRDMPADIAAHIDAVYKFDKDDVLDHVYHDPLPNTFVASFAPICSEFRDSEFIQNLLHNVFSEFVQKHLLKYKRPDWPHHFLGSIACEFETELRQVLNKFGLTPGIFERKPINALVKYHLNEYEV
jgi:glucosamine kinase